MSCNLHAVARLFRAVANSLDPATAENDSFWRRLQALDYEQFIGSLRLFFRSRPGVEYIDSTVFDTNRLLLFALFCLLLLVALAGRRVRRRLG